MVLLTYAKKKMSVLFESLLRLYLCSKCYQILDAYSLSNFASVKKTASKSSKKHGFANIFRETTPIGGLPSSLFQRKSPFVILSKIDITPEVLQVFS